jgi:hypothetical protein
VSRKLGDTACFDGSAREPLDQRWIYYSEHCGKRRVPRKALENFVNGLPAIALLEENIARYRADDQMDDEMEAIALKLLADWKLDPGSGEELPNRPGAPERE